MAANPVPPSPRPLQLDLVENTEQVAVVKCTGRLVNETTGELKDLVKSLFPTTRHVVLDLTDLNYMDSSGLGMLVQLKFSAANAKTRLELINISARIKDLLRLAKLQQVFEAGGDYMLP
jgi:anti-sigma B factor antagonist